MRSLLASPTVTIRRGGRPKPYRRIGNYGKMEKISKTCASERCSGDAERRARERVTEFESNVICERITVELEQVC